jgi:hypothetical protein
MLAILYVLGMFLADLFKSLSRIEAENMLLRHQLNLALWRRSPRLRLQGNDRVLLVWMIRLCPTDYIPTRARPIATESHAQPK